MKGKKFIIKKTLRGKYRIRVRRLYLGIAKHYKYLADINQDGKLIAWETTDKQEAKNKVIELHTYKQDKIITL